MGHASLLRQEQGSSKWGTYMSIPGYGSQGNLTPKWVKATASPPARRRLALEGPSRRSGPDARPEKRPGAVRRLRGGLQRAQEVQEVLLLRLVELIELV